MAAPNSEQLRSTRIKDLRQGLGGTGTDDREFLHKYMTLTSSDLLFADKAVLIEGTSERMLLPGMIDKVDQGLELHARLSSQYVSVLEVGGAHAHVFFDLLNFLELRTLVITDLDTANSADNGRACKVSVGTHSTNSCIASWFDDAKISPGALVSKNDKDKIKGVCRLAYQLPEKDGVPCGRSFEQAFILANPALFSMVGTAEDQVEEKSWSVADKVVKKSDFALRFAIREATWEVPRYIGEGLRWLADGGRTSGVVDAAPTKTVEVAELKI